MNVIPIQERFENPEGQWEHYGTYETDANFRIYRQKHVDIRDFNPESERISLSMVQLDQLTMSDLTNTKQMSDLEGLVILYREESWTAGVLDYQADRNHWKGLTMTLSAGTNTTESVIRL
jgi:hypothetical protein